MAKFKVGDRVRIVDVPESGHDVGDIGIIANYEKSMDYPYAVRVEGKRAHGSGASGCGDYLESELELVTESKQGEKVMRRRTFKLIKAMPGYKVGTLFQEQCEDGTQPYSPLHHEEGVNYPVMLEYRDRSFVENSPRWFTEVFKANPQYMTREELDKWEAFNAKPRKITVTKTDKRRGQWTPAKRRAHSAKLKAAWARKKAS